MKPVTLWYRETKDGPDYNHLEDGHCENDVPTPQCDAHKKCWGGKWSKKHLHSTDTIPAKVV